MPNIRIGYVNRWTTGTLTASTAATGLPAEASQNPDRSYVWRSTASTGAATLDIDLGAASRPTMVAVANVKLVGTGVLRLNQRGISGSPGSATLVATLPTQNTETSTAVVFLQVDPADSFRHWQLEWTNPSATSDYAELGFAFLGTYFEPTLNIKSGWESERPDPSVERVSLGRQKQFAVRPKYFRGSFVWDALKTTDFDTLSSVWHTVGRTTPVVLSVDAENAAWSTWFARLVEAPRRQHRLASRRHGYTLSWEEVL